jgi:multiple sugar transport system permease protein
LQWRNVALQRLYNLKDGWKIVEEASMATVTSRVASAARTWRSTYRLADYTNLLFLVPATFFFVGWQIYPIIRVFVLSFTDYKYLERTPPNFVGLQNYINALNDPLFHAGLLRAFAFTAAFVPLTILIPLVLAVLIDRVTTPWLSSFYRIVLLIPAVIPGPLVFVLWKWLFDFQIGPVNTILVDWLGIFTRQTAPQWLGGTPLSLPAVIIMEVWWGLGYHTMFFLAGLAAVPKDLSEQARIDGASEWQLFWRVIVPRLLPILSILVVLRFGTAMSVIDEYLIFGGFSAHLANVYLDGLYVRSGVPYRRLVAGIRCGDWLAGGADYDGLCGWNALRIPVARLGGGSLWLRQFSAIAGAVSQLASSPDMR